MTKNKEKNTQKETEEKEKLPDPLEIFEIIRANSENSKKR